MQSLVGSYMQRRKREMRQMGLVMNRAVNGGEDFDSLLDEMFPDATQDDEPAAVGEKWWDD